MLLKIMAVDSGGIGCQQEKNKSKIKIKMAIKFHLIFLFFHFTHLLFFRVYDFPSFIYNFVYTIFFSTKVFVSNLSCSPKKMKEISSTLAASRQSGSVRAEVAKKIVRRRENYGQIKLTMKNFFLFLLFSSFHFSSFLL